MTGITLYQNDKLQGDYETFNGDVENLKDFGFNDETSSCVIHSGTWILYKDANFQGDYTILTPGTYQNPMTMGLGNDSLSSLRRLPEANGPTILLFKDSNYRGEMVTLTGAQNDFKHLEQNDSKFNFNDAVSSAIVLQGEWNLYKDADYKGTMWSVSDKGGERDSGRYPKAGRYSFDNDAISSAKPA